MNFLESLKHVEQFSDDRTKGWPMVDSYWKALLAIIAYNLFVQIGVKYMKNRKSYKLKYPALIYNISVMLLNSYIFVEHCICGVNLGYSLLCNESTRNNTHPMEIRMTRSSWLFYMAKYLELIDTMFIILKKKEKNLSFLHVYHHSTVLFFTWLRTKWFPTGNCILVNILNSGVHIIMYTYYGLACFGPKVAKYLWWKKYLTIVQLVQFLSAAFVYCYEISTNCTFYPKWYVKIELFYAATLLFLFGHFYVNAYVGKKKQKYL